MSYKCPICGKTYDTADGLMKCVNTCGAKVKAAEEAAVEAKKKAVEAQQKVEAAKIEKKRQEINASFVSLKTLITSYNEEVQKFNAAYGKSIPTYEASISNKSNTTYKLNLDNFDKKDYDDLLDSLTNRLNALADKYKAKSNLDKTAGCKTSTVRKQPDKPTAYIFGLDDTESLDDLITNIFGF